MGLPVRQVRRFLRRLHRQPLDFPTFSRVVRIPPHPLNVCAVSSGSSPEVASGACVRFPTSSYACPLRRIFGQPLDDGRLHRVGAADHPTLRANTFAADPIRDQLIGTVPHQIDAELRVCRSWSANRLSDRTCPMPQRVGQVGEFDRSHQSGDAAERLGKALGVVAAGFVVVGQHNDVPTAFPPSRHWRWPVRRCGRALSPNRRTSQWAATDAPLFFGPLHANTFLYRTELP